MTDGFDDGKDKGALRTIGEVSQALDIKAHVLRYWEQQFPMLQPLKRSGGRRYYRPEDVALVETINRLVNREGYTLKGAKAAIKAGKTGAGADPKAALDSGTETVHKVTESAQSVTAPVETAASSSERDAIAELLPKLKAIRAQLAAAIAD